MSKAREITSYIRSLEKEIIRLGARVNDLQGLIKSGKRELPKNKTRERIVKYKALNPHATIREIQQKLKISSPSVVDFHLKKVRQFNEVK